MWPGCVWERWGLRGAMARYVQTPPTMNETALTDEKEGDPVLLIWRGGGALPQPLPVQCRRSQIVPSMGGGVWGMDTCTHTWQCDSKVSFKLNVHQKKIFFFFVFFPPVDSAMVEMVVDVQACACVLVCVVWRRFASQYGGTPQALRQWRLPSSVHKFFC